MKINIIEKSIIRKRKYPWLMHVVFGLLMVSIILSFLNRFLNYDILNYILVSCASVAFAVIIPILFMKNNYTIVKIGVIQFNSKSLTVIRNKLENEFLYTDIKNLRIKYGGIKADICLLLLPALLLRMVQVTL